jgi:hypothetical protein
MKAKKLNKRLSLNKKTIANLNNGEMRNAFGREIKIPVTTYALPDCESCETCQTCETCVTCAVHGSDCVSQCPYVCPAPL